MTESEIAAEFDRQHAALGHMWGYDTAKGRDQSAEAQIARCHAITGHGPAVLNRICDRALRQSVTIVPNRIAELERQVAEQAAVILDLRVQMADLLGGNRELTGMIDRVDQELADMTAERDAIRVDVCDMVVQRDHALLRMEAAIATSHGLIDELVERRIAEAKAIAESPHQSPHLIAAPPRLAFPSRALRHRSQPIGLLSTADAGRVRLGGYAPTLPPR